MSISRKLSKGKKKTRRAHALLQMRSDSRGSSRRRYGEAGALPALAAATGRRGRGRGRGRMQSRKPGSEYANSPPKRTAKARVANMHKKWLQHANQMAAAEHSRGITNRVDTLDVSQVSRGRGSGRGSGRGKGRGTISEILQEREVDNAKIGNAGLTSANPRNGPRSQSASKVLHKVSGKELR